MEVEIKTTNERSITIPVPCDREQLQQLGEWACESAAYGYTLKYAVTLSSGHQLDPHTVGLRLTAEQRA